MQDLKLQNVSIQIMANYCHVNCTVYYLTTTTFCLCHKIEHLLTNYCSRLFSKHSNTRIIYIYKYLSSAQHNTIYTHIHLQVYMSFIPYGSTPSPFNSTNTHPNFEISSSKNSHASKQHPPNMQSHFPLSEAPTSSLPVHIENRQSSPNSPLKIYHHFVKRNKEQHTDTAKGT